MQIASSFVVPVDVDTAWKVLLDVEQVAPCLPGASLDSFDGEEFTGTVAVKLGALSMRYRGAGRFLERDESARRVVFEASGREARGAGIARATVVAALHAVGDSTKVEVETELTVGGRAAQFGRSVMSDVTGRLLEQFAAALSEQINASAAPAAEPVPEPVPATARAGAGTTTGTAATTAGGATAPARGAAEPIDLLELGGATLFRRALVPAAVALVLLVLLVRRRAR